MMRTVFLILLCLGIGPLGMPTRCECGKRKVAEMGDLEGASSGNSKRIRTPLQEANHFWESHCFNLDAGIVQDIVQFFTGPRPSVNAPEYASWQVKHPEREQFIRFQATRSSEGRKPEVDKLQTAYSTIDWERGDATLAEENIYVLLVGALEAQRKTRISSAQPVWWFAFWGTPPQAMVCIGYDPAKSSLFMEGLCGKSHVAAVCKLYEAAGVNLHLRPGELAEGNKEAAAQNLVRKLL